MADLQEIDKLKKRQEAARDKKGRLAGQLEAAKQRFMEIVAKVKEAGYDPRTLRDTVAEKEQELTERVAAFEVTLTDVEEQLATFSEGVAA